MRTTHKDNSLEHPIEYVPRDPLGTHAELEEAELQFQRSFNVLSLIAPEEVRAAAVSVREGENRAPGRFWKAARKDLGIPD